MSLSDAEQYAYVPEWAKRILTKSAMERSENELSQLHSMLKGLTSYDKFTYRIQLAMCRAMTYLKVEHPRVVLRKGHVGVCFYFIFSGSVFVNVEELLTKTGHVMWHTAITLHRGDSFGELALLRNIKRTASVVVREDTELLMVEKNVFSKTCPRIYDKELFDKIKFCKGLSFFRHWAEEALRNVCFEAQIQEWKSNKIIVKDSSKELEWIYLCMQGKCSVIKALDLRVPPKPTRLKRVTNDDIYFPSGVLRRKRRTQSDPSKIWRKELKESLKTPFSFNENEMVDENQEDNERQWSDSEGEIAGAERILEVMAVPYKDAPHAKGDTDYIVNEEDEDDKAEVEAEVQQPVVQTAPSELERRDKRASESFSELIETESKAGKLNKDVVYLNIASLKNGDIFDVSEVLRPTGRRLMLVSKGAVMLRIRRDDFFRYSSKTTLRVARKMVQELEIGRHEVLLQINHNHYNFRQKIHLENKSPVKTIYPSEDIIYRSYNERCAWEQVKNTQLHSTMNSIQEKCIRHIKSFKQGTPGAKKPLTPARFSRGQSNEEEFDQYLSFVYDSHKVPGDVFESASSPFRKSTNEHLTSSTFRERTSGVNAGQPNISRKVTFSP
ncbi:hypothetical protein pdam_00023474 [Pocillopora damicornis]|uniref:Cyclic nucleotide-binding domain-containing protein n=1 Tax=Pocillopora damicornis TaxID=46731 RepID=A0A3M6T805_POCDA|nr:hypothetical protein pdam_00023474 [Pocillopora damicornis]